MLVPMQKLTLYALKTDRDALLLALQKDGSVMLEPEAGSKALPGAETVSAQLDKTGAVLQFLVQNGAKNPLVPQKEQVPYQDFLKETGWIPRPARSLPWKVKRRPSGPRPKACSLGCSWISPWNS